MVFKNNVFNYVAKLDDEKNFHEKFIASLLRDEIFSGKIWNNIREKLSISAGEIDCHNVSEQYYLGKRPVDILFQTKNAENQIILELKMKADDQPAQLWDYYTTALNFFEKAPILVYVTLDVGVPLNSKSIEPIKEGKNKSVFQTIGDARNIKDGTNKLEKGKHFFRISYNDLLKPLYDGEKQAEESNDHLMLLKLIKNYKSVLDYLYINLKIKNKKIISSEAEKQIDEKIKIQKKSFYKSWDSIERDKFISLIKKSLSTEITDQIVSNQTGCFIKTDNGDFGIQYFNETKQILYGIKRNENANKFIFKSFEKLIKYLVWNPKNFIDYNRNNYNFTNPKVKNDEDKKELKELFPHYSDSALYGKVRGKNDKKYPNDWFFSQNVFNLLSQEYPEFTEEEMAKKFVQWIINDYHLLKTK